jgi:hypothetical protein
VAVDADDDIIAASNRSSLHNQVDTNCVSAEDLKLE